MRFLKWSLPAKTLQSSAYEPETHTPTFWVRHLDSRFPRVMQLVSLTRSVVLCLGWMIILWQFELVNSPCYVCATCFGFSHELPVAVVGKHTSVKVGQIERCPRKKEVVDIRLSVHLHQFGSDNLNVLNNTSLIRCEVWTQLQRLITFCTEYTRTIGFRGCKAWAQGEFFLAMCMIKSNLNYHKHIPIHLPFLYNVSFEIWLRFDGTVEVRISELLNRVVSTITDDVIGFRG